MALGTAGDKGAEDIKAFHFLWVKRLGIAVGILVIAAVQGDQRTLKGCQGSGNLIQTQISAMGKRLPKQLWVGFNCFQATDQLRWVVTHFLR